MPLYRFIEVMLVAPVDFSAGGNNVGVIDCLCVCMCFVLSFFVIWTIGVRDKLSVALNCIVTKITFVLFR